MAVDATAKTKSWTVGNNGVFTRQEMSKSLATAPADAKVPVEPQV